jgi:hypothetical protein
MFRLHLTEHPPEHADLRPALDRHLLGTMNFLPLRGTVVRTEESGRDLRLNDAICALGRP